MRKVIMLVVLFLFVHNLKGQNPDTTSRLTVVKGGSVYFPINSMDKLENGMEYLSWTRLRVYFRATNSSGNQSSQWRLTVHANDNDINGDNSNNLDLATVQIRVESSGAGNVYGGWHSLDDTPVIELIDEGDNVNTIDVVISYRCGMDTPTYDLLGESSDYYTVDLVYTIEPDP